MKCMEGIHKLMVTTKMWLTINLQTIRQILQLLKLWIFFTVHVNVAS